MNFLRQKLPLAIAFVVGVVMIVQYYVPTRLSQQVGARAVDGYIIIRGLVIFLGIASLLHVHGRKVARKQAGWGYSVFVFVGFALMLVAGFFSAGKLDDGTAYKWFYDYTMVPLGATLFSILAFFIVSAAYRAFRARSVDATLLLLAAVVVLFGKVPWGEYIIGSNTAKAVVNWIMLVPNAAATRGIILGVALGMIATSIKIILGIERAYLGGGD